MNDDAQCLEQYIREGSEPAFRKLVERYLALVNSTARRLTGGNVHLAQDVTQQVFTDLARKAGSLPRGTILGGWLHRHTCYTALKALRTENRRQKRERIAMELNALDENSGHDAHWLELAPVLDEALNSLGTPDRDVIILRYFQQQDIHSIGQNLGATETATQKRLGRALDKLRAILTRRGVTLASAAMLGSTLEAGVVTSVPVGMVATISTAAVGSATTLGTGLTLLTLKTMITSKLALGLAAAVVVVGATVAIVSHNNNSPTPTLAPLPQAATPSVKIPAPPVAIAAKVEAPKLAPAPAGNAPATPNDIAASATPLAQPTGTLTFRRALNANSGTLNLNGSNTYTGPTTVNVGAVNTAASGAGSSLQQMKFDLKAFKEGTASAIAYATSKANGDPDQLAKIETARQEYEKFAQDRQKAIDELSAKTAMGEQSAPSANSP